MTLRSFVPLIAALVGIGVGIWAFVNTVSTALDGGGNGSGIWQLVFFAALGLVVASVVLCIVNVVKKRDVVISVATLFVTAAPLLVVLIFVVALTAQGN